MLRRGPCGSPALWASRPLLGSSSSVRAGSRCPPEVGLAPTAPRDNSIPMAIARGDGKSPSQTVGVKAPMSPLLCTRLARRRVIKDDSPQGVK